MDEVFYVFYFWKIELLGSWILLIVWIILLIGKERNNFIEYINFVFVI